MIHFSTLNPMKIDLRIRLLFFYLLSSVIAFNLLSYLYNEIQQEKLKNNSEVYSRAYQMAYQQFNLLSQAILSGVMHRASLDTLYEEINKGNDEDKKRIRENLYQLLKPRYQALKKSVHLRQLHFHLKNNDSFLRMHRPNKYGDNLTKDRLTVSMVNRTHQAIDGFEEGKIFNGFRFVYPITSKNKTHLGSIEVSFDAVAIVNKMVQHYDIISNFYISSTQIEEKVFKDERKNYASSKFDGYLIDKKVTKELKQFSDLTLDEGLSSVTIQQLLASLSKRRPYSLHDDTHYIFTIIPVINPVSHKVVAFFLVRSNDSLHLSIFQNFYFQYLLLQILVTAIYLVIYLQLSKALLYRNMLDAQTSILVVSDGLNIHDVNLQFLPLFNMKSLKEFTSQYQCICEVFVADEQKGYISGEYWRENKLFTQSESIKVQFYDGFQQLRKFKLTSTPFSTNQFLYTLDEITDLEKIHDEVAIKTNEQKQLLSLFNKGSVSLFKWRNDTTWSVEYCSKNVQELLGHEPSVFLKNEIEYAQLIHPDDLNRVEKEINEAINNKHNFIVHQPYRILTPLKEEKWLLDSTLLIRDEEENITHFLGYLADISALIMSQQQIDEKTEELNLLNKNLGNIVEQQIDELRQKDITLQQPSKMALMGEMIGAIAHQWRQPLNALNINIQNLDDDYEDGLIDEQFIDEFITKNHKTIEFMSHTIEDFSNFFKIDKVKEEFSVLKSLTDTIQILIAQFKSHQIEVIINGDDFNILGFRREFQQVILNIINNAKEAILDCIEQNELFDKGLISIDLLVKNDIKIIRIIDNAGGIPEPIISRIFEPYFTTKDPDKGTGIGLYMSKMIIEQNMSGKLTAKNISHELSVETSTEKLNLVQDDLMSIKGAQFEICFTQGGKLG